MRFKFNTSLDLKECQKRLSEKLATTEHRGEESVLIESSKNPSTESGPTIVGRVSGQSFSLRVRRNIDVAGLNFAVRNSFAPVCSGTLRTNQGQTNISGRIGIHPFIIAFVLIWFFGIIGIGGYAITSIAADITTGLSNTDNLITACIVIGGLIACGLLIILGGNWASKDDQIKFIHFIKNILDVRDSR